ncbi:MAG: tetratricopeptide repeat protein [Nitrospira sp.]|nr:tetratricopeptide repeat protein [Nitrospira sp.]
MPVAGWPLLGFLLSAGLSGWEPIQSPPIQLVSSAGQLTGDELLRIGEIHDHQHHFRETLTYYQLALTQFRKAKQPRGVAAALVKIALVHERQGKMQEAYIELQEAVSIYARSVDRLAHARALLAMGRIAAGLGQIDVARDSLRQATTLFDRAKDRRGIQEAGIQLGLLEVADGSAEPGMTLLQQALENARASQDPAQQLAATVALGDAQWLLDRESEARAYYETSLRLAQAERNMAIEASLRLRLAYLDSAGGRVKEALESSKQAILLSQTLRDPLTEAKALSLLADLYRQTEEAAEAEAAEQRAISIYRHRQIVVHGMASATRRTEGVGHADAQASGGSPDASR